MHVRGYLLMQVYLHPTLWKSLAPEKEPDVLTEKPTPTSSNAAYLLNKQLLPFTLLPTPTELMCATHEKYSHPATQGCVQEDFPLATPSTSSPGDLYKSQQAQAEPLSGLALAGPPCQAAAQNLEGSPKEMGGAYTTPPPHQKAHFSPPNIRMHKEPQQTHGYQEII